MDAETLEQLIEWELERAVEEAQQIVVEVLHDIREHASCTPDCEGHFGLRCDLHDAIRRLELAERQQLS